MLAFLSKISIMFQSNERGFMAVLSTWVIKPLSSTRVLAQPLAPVSTLQSSGLWFENNLRIAFDALVKFIIGRRGIVERNVIRDDKAGFRTTRNDHIAQVAIVALHVALPGAQAQALLKELAKGDAELPLFGVRIYSSWIRRHIEARNTQPACRVDDLNERFEHDRGHLLVLLAGLDGLVADGIDTLVNAVAVAHLTNLLNRIALAEINWNGSHILDILQALGHPINHIDLGCSTNQRVISSHCPDRASSKDRYRLARRDMSQLCTVIAGGEDIGQQGKIFFVLRALWQFERIEVDIGDAQIFGLTTWIRPHRYISISATCKAWIDGEAEAGKTSLAVLTEAAGNIEGHDDPITLMERGDPRACLLNDTHILMPEDDARLCRRSPLVHM